VLPGLITALTPIRYKTVVMKLRDALVTGFATGNLFVILPMLAKRSKELIDDVHGSSEETGEMVDIIAPTSYTFPSAGKLLVLAFILFAGWMTGFPVSIAKYPMFAITGFFTWFGSTYISIPFMLDMFRIPADTFQLFIVVDNVFGRFGVMVAVIHVATLSVLGSLAVGGLIKVRPLKVVRYLVVTALIVIGTFTGIHLAFNSIGSRSDQYESFIGRPLFFEPAEYRLVDSSKAEIPPEATDVSALTRIAETGRIRVGYPTDALPWVFRNSENELVGFDVEMVHRFARELGVAVDFHLVDPDKVPGLLGAGFIDMMLGGLSINSADMKRMTFTAPYMDETVAFVIEDHRREDFNTEESLRKQKGLRVGIGNNEYYAEKLQEYLPDAEIIVLDSPREFFRHEKGDIDAMVTSAETGSSWCLVYPEFTVAVPHPKVRAVPMAYAVRFGDREMAEFLSTWIELKKKDGTIENLFAYWIEGKKIRAGGKRWSVIRNVLGWVD
jgi:ABC-type amino acid transport substrate-binding protein